MKAWWIYTKERFPLVVYTILVGGFSASGTLLAGGILLSREFLFSFLGLMVFFAMLRMMDEVKDYHKDCIANPTRPLPRGLLPVEQVKKVILLVVLGMGLFAGCLFFAHSPVSGLIFLGLTVHLWLMYVEFYLGPWLEARQILYATTHQLVLVWVSLFPVVMTDSQALAKSYSWYYAFTVLGSFFTYEVSRKLDPNAHVLLKTYRQMYGIKGCLGIILVTTTIALISGYYLGVYPLTAVFAIAVPLSYLLLRFRLHKVVEAVASLSLVIHIWSVFLLKLFGKL